MKRSGCWSVVKWTLFVICTLLLVVIAGIYWQNTNLPTSLNRVDRLSERDEALLAEATHLRNALADSIWPGWGQLDIPWLVYNRKYAFLKGLSNPDTGWIRVPHDRVIGTAWEQVEGRDYYRQALSPSSGRPQAFIVQIGDRYVASMTTREWTEIQMIRSIEEQLPGFLSPVFPYTLFLKQFNSDWYVSALLHESFHALQAVEAFEKLEAAERATSNEGDYPWGDDDFRNQWLKERRLLAGALQPGDSASIARKLTEWMNVRKSRRQILTEEQVRYEKQREWLEGLAKYAELNIWKKANDFVSYESLPGTKQISDFEEYDRAESHWKQEIGQLERNLQFDETIFYYSGWAQAQLLDRIHPGWKHQAMEEEIYLEDLFAPDN